MIPRRGEAVTVPMGSLTVIVDAVIGTCSTGVFS
jgi:hypothetical protein